MDGDRRTTWLLFDEDCRVCNALATWVHAVDFRGRLRVQAIQEYAGLLAGVPPAKALDSIHAVAPDGRVATGPDAVPMVLGALSGAPELELLLRSSPPAMSVLSRTYDLLAEVRGRLSCRPGGPVSGVRAPR